MEINFWEDIIFNSRILKSLYKHGISDSKGEFLSSKHRLISLIKEKLSQLLNGLYQEADLDFKHNVAGYPVFTIRLNDSDRLILVAKKVRGKSYLIAVDIIINHDYQKSLIENSPALKKFLEVNQHHLEQQVLNEQTFKTMLSSLRESSPHAETDIELSPFTLHDNSFVLFDEQQQKALGATPPLLMEGLAGSGKTSIDYSFIMQAINQELHLQGQGLILYVTPEEALALSMYDLVDEALKLQGLEAKNVIRCLSYRQLAEELAPGKKWQGEAEFQSWFNHYKKTRPEQMQAAKSTKIQRSKSQSFLSNSEQVYKELRIIAAYDTLEEYLKLGEKQCNCQDETERKWLWTMMIAYQKEVFNLEIYRLAPTKTRFCLIIADELQNFFYSQLRNLLYLSQGNFCGSGDRKQSINDNLNAIDFLKQFLNEQHRKDPRVQPTFIQLPYTYRSPPAFAKLINQVYQQKLLLLGGTEQKDDLNEFRIAPDFFGKEEGLIEWVSTEERFQEIKAEFAKANTNYAIVTPCVKDAQQHFTTPLIITAAQSGGREYPTVIVYLPFDGENFNGFHKANTFWMARDLANQPIPTHQPKETDPTRNYWASLVASLVVMYSRAKLRLIIIQPIKHGLEALIEYQQRSLNALSATAPPALMQLPESTKQDWEKEHRKQKRAGNDLIAQQIEQQYLSLAAKPSSSASSSTPAASSSPSRKQITKKEKTASNQGGLTKTPASKELLYIEQLLKEYSLPNLDSLFNHPRALTYLFDIPLTDSSCLFHKLVSTEKTAFLLLTLLKKNILYLDFLKSKIKTLEDDTINHWANNAPESAKELICLLLDVNYAKNAKLIYQELVIKITAKVKYDTSYSETQLVLKLDDKVLGEDYVKMILSDDKTFSTYLIHQRYRLLSVIYTEIKAGRFEKSVNIIQSISAKTLFLLASSTEGLELFAELLKARPELSNMIFWEDLFENQNLPGFLKTSALFFLAATPEGCDVLLRILKFRTTHISLTKIDVIVEKLCKHDQRSLITGASILYLLAGSFKGIMILIMMMKKESELFNLIYEEVKKELTTPKGLNKVAGTAFSALELISQSPLLETLERCLPENTPKIGNFIQGELENIRNKASNKNLSFFANNQSHASSSDSTPTTRLHP